MPLKRTQPGADLDDPFLPGVYLTDGTSLFNVVGALPHEPSLRLVEDCGTLEILMVHVDGLRAPGVRRVDAMRSEQIEGEEAISEETEDASSSSLERVGHTHR
jgi:hypothetical protein